MTLNFYFLKMNRDLYAQDMSGIVTFLGLTVLLLQGPEMTLAWFIVN